MNISEIPDFSSILCDFQSVQNSLTEKCLPIFSRFSSSSGYPAIPLRQIWWLYPSRYVGSVGTDFFKFSTHRKVSSLQPMINPQLEFEGTCLGHLWIIINFPTALSDCVKLLSNMRNLVKAKTPVVAFHNMHKLQINQISSFTRFRNSLPFVIS